MRTEGYAEGKGIKRGYQNPRCFQKIGNLFGRGKSCEYPDRNTGRGLEGKKKSNKRRQSV